MTCAIRADGSGFKGVDRVCSGRGQSGAGDGKDGKDGKSVDEFHFDGGSLWMSGNVFVKGVGLVGVI